jgi:hypothetical protein
MMLQNLWYDFDRVPFTSKYISQGKDLLEWDEVKLAIEEGTAIIVEEAAKHAEKLNIVEESLRVKELESFVQKCLDSGFLDEEFDEI